MKKTAYLLIVLVCLNLAKTKGQCIAHAGPDKIICSNKFGVDTTQIGANPAATGGTPPYTYKWEADHRITIGSTTYIKTASDYLNDTTLAMPLVIASEKNPVTFTLTVTDQGGSSCKDTVVIQFSQFLFLLGYLAFDISQGDSVHLNHGTNLSSNFPPFQYLWKPNTGLKDSTNLSFWAKPAVSTAYYLKLTDSAGCTREASPYYYVNVLPVSLKETINNTFQLSVFPNPAHGITTIKVAPEPHGMLLFEFFNTTGQRIKSIETTAASIQLNTTAFPEGCLFYKITERGKLIGQGKLFVK